MEIGPLVAASRQIALKLENDTISHNISNLNTDGYRSSNIKFGAYVHNGGEGKKTSFVVGHDIYYDFKEGGLRFTGNPLDLGMSGDPAAFFAILTPNGVRYTRASSYLLNNQGQIVNSEGYPLLSQAQQPIVVPPGSGNITVSEDGIINTTNNKVVGQVGRFHFNTLNSNLRQHGGGQFSSTDDPIPATNAKINQGTTESSNVNAIQQFARMTEALRNFQQIQEILEKDDQISRDVSNTVKT